MTMRYGSLTPAAMREIIRKEEYTGQTSGLCPGYAQANLVVLPEEYAYDFLLFAQRNPKACPLLEVTDTGSRFLKEIAPGADLAADLPRYRIYENGVLTGEYTNVERFWRNDLVSFLIGCSFSFEGDLLAADVPVRQIEEGKNVPMYDTDLPCAPAGVFHGNMVVSMRPIPYELVPKAVQITGAMPRVHGAPIHIGDPAAIGIADLSRPDYGEAVTVKDGEVPVFWPCGVTPQNALLRSKPSFAITHAPGHMLITDVKNVNLKY